MSIPKDPKERFQYYFDITTGLDEKYQKKINQIQMQDFNFNVEDSREYKEFAEQNKEDAEYLKNKYSGDYAEYSQGYDNSMQKVANRQIEQQSREADEAARESITQAKYEQWLTIRNNRIEAAKKKYASEFAKAIYNMQKANEEITLRKQMGI